MLKYVIIIEVKYLEIFETDFQQTGRIQNMGTNSQNIFTWKLNFTLKHP